MSRKQKNESSEEEDEEEISLKVKFGSLVSVIGDIPVDISNEELFSQIFLDLFFPSLKLPGSKKISLHRPKNTLKKYVRKSGFDGSVLRAVLEMKEMEGKSSKAEESHSKELENAEKEIKKLKDELAKVCEERDESIQKNDDLVRENASLKQQLGQDRKEKPSATVEEEQNMETLTKIDMGTFRTISPLRLKWENGSNIIEGSAVGEVTQTTLFGPVLPKSDGKIVVSLKIVSFSPGDPYSWIFLGVVPENLSSRDVRLGAKDCGWGLWMKEDSKGTRGEFKSEKRLFPEESKFMKKDVVTIIVDFTSGTLDFITLDEQNFCEVGEIDGNLKLAFSAYNFEENEGNDRTSAVVELLEVE